jgi:hypothetical protein
MIPGQNILNMAFSAIGKQSFSYYAFLTRTTNSIGQDVASYAFPCNVLGSVQPVPRSLYQQYGLEFDRYYLNVYMPQSAIDVARDVSGDALMYNCNWYQVLSKTDWFQQDGWVSVLAVQIPALPGVIS